jgi:hypothetical protein
MLVQEIDESYALSRLPKGPLTNVIPRGYSNRNLVLGLHPLGDLVARDEVHPPLAWCSDAEQQVSRSSKGAYTPKLPSHSPTLEDKLDQLRRGVQSLEIAQTRSFTSRCDSFSDSQSSTSSHQQDVSRKEHYLDESIYFPDANTDKTERLEFFRTTRLRCQIYAILRPKMANREIGYYGFMAFAESVTYIRFLRCQPLLNSLVTGTCQSIRGYMVRRSSEFAPHANNSHDY